VKQDAERLWRKLVELYEGRAHLALGYSAWGVYCDSEFGMKQSRAYQLLDAGRVARVLDSTPGGIRPPTEKHARALAPLRDEPDQLREAWAEVVELHPEPTAAHVRDVVQQRRPQPPATEEEKAQPRRDQRSGPRSDARTRSRCASVSACISFAIRRIAAASRRIASALARTCSAHVRTSAGVISALLLREAKHPIGLVGSVV
jgi:hypothetical protein